MISLSEVMERVDLAFESASAKPGPWPDPHPDRSPTDVEYSRVTNPEKWRIVGARADAWLDALHDTGVTTGVGDPTVVHTWIPDCSCDACDSGSQDALDELDGHLAGIVTGQFRRLQRGERTITVASDRTLQSSGGDSLLNVDRASQTPRAGASSPDRAGWPGSRPA